MENSSQDRFKELFKQTFLTLMFQIPNDFPCNTNHKFAECSFALHAMKVNGAVKLIKHTLVQYIPSLLKLYDRFACETD